MQHFTTFFCILNILVKTNPDKICSGNQACRPADQLYPVSKIMSQFRQDSDLT